MTIDEQWLDAKAIANQGQLATSRIPHDNGEHPNETASGFFNPPLLERGEDYLGVRVPPKPAACRFQVAPQPPMIEDLAVEDDGVAFIPGGHWLMSHVRKIHDRQAPKTQCDAGGGVDPHATVVGASMRDGACHPQSDGAHLLRIAVSRPEKTCQAAHKVGGYA